jgi:hypothetical protein
LNNLTSFEGLIFENKFKLIRRIGKGGQACIYLANKIISQETNGDIKFSE